MTYLEKAAVWMAMSLAALADTNPEDKKAAMVAASMVRKCSKDLGNEVRKRVQSDNTVREYVEAIHSLMCEYDNKKK